jgi:hypothetical protein
MRNLYSSTRVLLAVTRTQDLERADKSTHLLANIGKKEEVCEAMISNLKTM